MILKNVRGRLGKDHWISPQLSLYRGKLALALVLSLLASFFAAGLMFTSGWLIGGSAAMPYSVLLLGTPLLLVRVFGVGKPLLQYAERLCSHDWVLRMTSTLRKKLFCALDSQDALARKRQKLGDSLSMLAEDVEHMQNLFLRCLFPTAVASVLGLILTAALGSLTWWMGLSMLLFCIVELVAVPALSLAARHAGLQREQELSRTLYARATDDVLGITDWVLSGRHDSFMRHCQTIARERAAEKRRAKAFDRKRSIAQQAIWAVMAVLTISWAACAFGAPESSAQNMILAFALGFFPLIDVFAPVAPAAVEAAGHVDALRHLNKLPKTERNSCTAHPKKEPKESLDIAFEEMSYAYPDAPEPVLQKISMTIPFGQKTAVLGESGAGKSTLLMLLHGDVSPTQGRVTVGGMPCSDIVEISRYLGIIQQDTYLFNDTLRNNLRIGKPEACDEEIESVLERVGLKKLLAQLEQGLDTLIDEAGLRFSGGERQRIALARVLLQDAPIVVLDEPTVGLDPATERQVLNTFFSALENKTIIMVTHHLAGIERMDRVLFLEEGRIVLDGSPTELEQTSSYYRRLRKADASWMPSAKQPEAL